MASPLQPLFDILKSQELQNQLGLGALRIIKKRTREGRDIQGNAFRPYSKGYKKKRLDNDLPIDIVNLVWDDQQGMMSKTDFIISDDLKSISLIIDDDDKKEIAEYHNVKGAGKGKVIRKFWGFSPEEEEQLQGLADSIISNIIAKL